MILLIILGFVFAYITACGAVYPSLLAKQAKACPWSGHQSAETGVSGKHVTTPCEIKHRPEAIALSLAGPLLIPFFLGAKMSPADKAEKRRQAEKAEAEHRVELAELSEKEHAALDRELDLLERKRKIAMLQVNTPLQSG